MKQKIQILIVDDHPLMRKVAIRRLEIEDDMKVIAEAANGLEAVKLTKKNSPDVILMDINMPKMDGITATKKIMANDSQAIIIGLSSNSKERYDKIMKQAGAVAYHPKSDCFKILCETIRNKVVSDVVQAT